MDDYLLDNNIISMLVKGQNDSVWAASDKLYPKVAQHFCALSGAHLFIPAMAVAEIEFGMAVVDDCSSSPLSPSVIAHRAALRQFFGRYPQYEFGEHTVERYALIRARLWKKFGTSTSKAYRFKEKLPEELFDNQAGEFLKIDEKDLIIVSIALEHNIIFATCDRRIGMNRIVQAADELKQEGKLKNVRYQYWDS